MADFFCECDDPDCRETIPLELDEMLFLRRRPGFIVAPGHQEPDDEIIGTDSDNRFIFVADRESEPARKQPSNY